MTTDNQPTSPSTTMLECTNAYPWRADPEIKGSDNPGTWSATVLQYEETREGRDTDQSFMNYYMGGGPMVSEGQEVKLFVTEVLRETKRVTVTMNWRPVRDESAQAKSIKHCDEFSAWWDAHVEELAHEKNPRDVAEAGWLASKALFPIDLEELESLQQWFVAYASGAGGEPEFSNIKSWTKALAAITGQPVPKRWED